MRCRIHKGLKRQLLYPGERAPLASQLKDNVIQNFPCTLFASSFSKRSRFNLLPPSSQPCLGFTLSILFLVAAVYFFYPSDPALQVSRIWLHHIQVNSSPKLTLDLSFSLLVKVRNRDFYSLDYDSLDVSVGYRGRELGIVSSQGANIKARGSSYVNATLNLDGLEVMHDLFYLIEDLARGVIPFDTSTKVNGRVGLLFFTIPIKGRVSCEVYVNTANQTIVREDCYPE